MTNSARFVVVSPADDSVVYEGSLATAAELDGALSRAVKAQRAWGASPLAARVEAVLRFLSDVEAEKDDAARDFPGREVFKHRAGVVILLRPVLDDLKTMIGCNRLVS